MSASKTTCSILTSITCSFIFLRLKDIGAVEPELAQRLVAMAKFRNRLVHLYWEIQAEKISEIIQNDLDDFKAFEKSIVHFLKRRSL